MKKAIEVDSICWERAQVMRSLTAVFSKRGAVDIRPSEEHEWEPGYIILIADGDDAPFLNKDDSPSGDLIAILRRSGWAMHKYDHELFFLAPATVTSPAFKRKAHDTKKEIKDN